MIYQVTSFLLDIIFSMSLPSAYQNISYFYPLLFIGCIPISYLLTKNKKYFFLLIVILGIIYDLLFSDIPLLNLYYFVFYGLFLYIFYNNKEKSYLNIILISIIGIIFYDFYLFLILNLTKYASLKIEFLNYKIIHSLALNIIYILISIFLLKGRIFGYKKRRKKL